MVIVGLAEGTLWAEVFVGVLGLGDDLPLRPLLENLAQPLAHQRVVVPDQDSQLSQVIPPRL